jgi:hypothetical protein
MEEETQIMETGADTETDTGVDVDEDTDRSVDIEIPEAGKSELAAIGVEEAELKHVEPGANEDITAVTEFTVTGTEAEMGADADAETDAGVDADVDADVGIVTESAAELYLKQGLVNDALVIYKKLYDSQKEERFLIKINQLKSQQVTRGKILVLTEFLRLIRQKQEQ